MIEFKKNYSMKNGNKVTKKNWQNVVAISSKPDNCNQGWDEIEKIKKENGAYFEKWKLVFEKNEDSNRTGYIFREIITNTGINGHHKTFKEAIWYAMNPYIRVFLEE